MELDIRFKILSLAIIAVLFSSCKKAEDRTCFKTLGEESSLELPLPRLDKLSVTGKIKYILIQDSTDKAVVHGGKNIIKHIDFYYDADSVLHISNKNKCNALRSMKHQITVELHISDLSLLTINSGDSVVSRGTLKSPLIYVKVNDGAASIALDFDVYQLDTYVVYGFADLTYTGKAKICNNNISFASSLNALGLKVSDYIYIHSFTSQPVYFNADHTYLQGLIRSNGDIYYEGTPSNLDVEMEGGNGKLIKLQ